MKVPPLFIFVNPILPTPSHPIYSYIVIIIIHKTIIIIYSMYIYIYVYIYWQNEMVEQWEGIVSWIVTFTFGRISGYIRWMTQSSGALLRLDSPSVGVLFSSVPNGVLKAHEIIMQLQSQVGYRAFCGIFYCPATTLGLKLKAMAHKSLC